MEKFSAKTAVSSLVEQAYRNRDFRGHETRCILMNPEDRKLYGAWHFEAEDGTQVPIVVDPTLQRLTAQTVRKFGAEPEAHRRMLILYGLEDDSVTDEERRETYSYYGLDGEDV